MKMSNVIGGMRKTIVKRSPEILTGLGIAGMFTTTILVVKATPKAIRILQEKEDAIDEELTKKEVAKAVWKCYIPAASSFVLSSVCLIGANSVHAKRSTALAAAVKLSESAIREYRDAVIETIGEEKEKEVRHKVQKKKLEKNPASNADVIIVGDGDILCYESVSGRYFKSTKANIKNAQNAINYRINTYMYASLSELYEELGLPNTSVSDYIGWNIDGGLLEIEFSAHISDDDRPCLAIDYIKPPEYDFDQFNN